MSIISGFGLGLAALLASSAAQDLTDLPSATEILEGAPASDWVRIPEENLLVMDLPSGTMIIEVRPDLAPRHVERVTTLTKQGFYDGVLFHRVLEGFMAQGGDPTATGTGGSDLPDLAAEFVQSLPTFDTVNILGRDDRAAQVGFVGTVPVGTQAPTLGIALTDAEAVMWGLHCQGVLSMARAGAPNSANSQFFVMFGDRRDNLDQQYTVWGKVVDGYRNARRINRGEPPARPTPIVRMRVMTDVPDDEKTVVEHLRTDSPVFVEYLQRIRAINDVGYVDDTCAIDVPVRINGEITQ